MVANYYSPYLFWCAVFVVVLAFYDKPKELTNLPKVIFPKGTDFTKVSDQEIQRVVFFLDGY